MAKEEKLKLDEEALDVVNGGYDIPAPVPENVIPDWPPRPREPLTPPRPVPNPFAPVDMDEGNR